MKGVGVKASKDGHPNLLLSLTQGEVLNGQQNLWAGSEGQSRERRQTPDVSSYPNLTPVIHDFLEGQNGSNRVGKVYGTPETGLLGHSLLCGRTFSEHLERIWSPSVGCRAKEKHRLTRINCPSTTKYSNQDKTPTIFGKIYPVLKRSRIETNKSQFVQLLIDLN